MLLVDCPYILDVVCHTHWCRRLVTQRISQCSGHRHNGDASSVIPVYLTVLHVLPINKRYPYVYKILEQMTDQRSCTQLVVVVINDITPAECTKNTTNITSYTQPH